MKCPKCHSDNLENTDYCGKCGTRMRPEEEKSASQTDTLHVPIEKLVRGKTFAERYEVIEEIGQGGMGTVYRVFDKRIKEVIALKLLDPELADDETIERFSNELKFARKIAHKNVARMYDINEEEGAYYITMEYVSGEDLKSFIRRAGRLSLSKSVSIAKQVGEGLAEAHRLGLIHRDLKPGNMMIDKEGSAHIMDFGIAQSLKGEEITDLGVMIGTPAYMPPEQAIGEEADQRSDIYSLGVILFEMVTGRLPFEADTLVSLSLKHRKEPPPDPRDFSSQVPEDLSQVILKCIEKEKEKRYQTVEGLLSDLSKIEEELTTVEGTVLEGETITLGRKPISAGWKRFVIPGVAFLTLVAVVVLSLFFFKDWFSKKAILLEHKQVTFSGNVYSTAISPDGKSIAYTDIDSSGEAKLMMLDVQSDQSIEVFRASSILYLKWLPNNNEISFLARIDDPRHRFHIIPRLGGSTRKFTEFSPSQYYSWSPDGSRLSLCYVNLKLIRFINISSGTREDMPVHGDFRWIKGVDWSPLSNFMLFLTEDDKKKYAIWTISVDGSTQNIVVEERVPMYSPSWSPNGNFIYYFRGKEQTKELWKIPVSTENGEALKSPIRVLAGLQAGEHFNLSNDGKRLVYSRELSYSNLWLAAIEGTGKDRIVKTKQLTSGTLSHNRASISPDGTQIAFSRGDGEIANIYVMPVEGDKLRQITFFKSLNDHPVWSPDGREIAFGSNEGGDPRVWKVNVQGGQPYQFEKTKLSNSYHLAWAPGAKILYQRPGNRIFHILNPKTGEEAPLVEDKLYRWMFDPFYSPDGKKVAVRWRRQPKEGLWLVSLEDSTEKFLKEGRISPFGWSADGNWIYAFNLTEDKELMVDTDSGASQPFFNLEGYPQCISPDEKKIIFVKFNLVSDVWLVENFDQDSK